MTEKNAIDSWLGHVNKIPCFPHQQNLLLSQPFLDCGRSYIASSGAWGGHSHTRNESVRDRGQSEVKGSTSFSR